MPASLKRIGILFAALIGLIVLALAYTQVSAEIRLRRTYDFQVESVSIPYDESALERGRELVVTGRCTECHGLDMGGQITADAPAVGEIYASNLTTGLGGVGNTYTGEDWVRAIRHGTGQDGRSLVITPAQYYYYLSDDDLGAIITNIKSLPPVDNDLPDPAVGPLGRLFVALFSPRDWLPAEKIDHTGPRPESPIPGITAEYGEYLVKTRTCLVCHRPKDISGASEGALAGWSESDFIFKLRFSGDRSMSTSVRRTSDEDLQAMWQYLQSMPITEESHSS